MGEFHGLGERGARFHRRPDREGSLRRGGGFGFILIRTGQEDQKRYSFGGIKQGKDTKDVCKSGQYL